MNTIKMKAAVCYEFGKPLVLDELELTMPQAGEVAVRIAACAICHSDLTYIDGNWGGSLPQVFGHEASGVVEQVGTGVHSVKVGDHVLVTLLRSCGYCGSCKASHPNTCETKFPLDLEARMHNSDGTKIQQGLRTGAFAEYSVVDQSQVAVIPNDLPFDVASLLSCGVITGFGAVVNTARMPANANAAIIGCGGVGLNAVQGAAYMGAFPLLAVDALDSKLKTAKEFGATHTVNATQADVRQVVDELTNKRGMEYVFTTAGSSQAIEQGMKLLAPNGTLTIVGMPPDGDLVSIDACEVAGTNLRILGSKMGSTKLQTDIPKLIGLYQDGRLNLDELISNRYSIEDINQAIDDVRQNKVLRNVIVF